MKRLLSSEIGLMEGLFLEGGGRHLPTPWLVKGIEDELGTRQSTAVWAEREGIGVLRRTCYMLMMVILTLSSSFFLMHRIIDSGGTHRGC